LYLEGGDYFRFSSVFIKKNNQIEIFFLKKTKTRSNRPVSVRFGFLGQKPVQTGLARFFRFGSVFFRFFLFRFGFLLIKPNQTGWLFQNFNRFNMFFFGYFFFGFFGLIGFSVFLLTPSCIELYLWDTKAFLWTEFLIFDYFYVFLLFFLISYFSIKFIFLLSYLIFMARIAGLAG